MAEVRVEVGGRTYPLACRTGEEELIRRLAAVVDEKARTLTSQLGYLPEVRLLLMSAIMIAEEMQRQGSASGSDAGNTDQAAADPDREGDIAVSSRRGEEAERAAAVAIDRAAERVESLLAALDRGELDPPPLESDRPSA